MNNIDLKIACIIICKYVNFQSPSDSEYIIIPSCLRVDIATTFLKSPSRQATNPATNIVITPKIFRISLNIGIENMKLNRISKYTPAVTSVEECTNDETGVGAAMAAGSQAENGIWALFVIAAIIRNVNIILSLIYIESRIQYPFRNRYMIDIRIPTSPTRFEYSVNIPDTRDLLF
jgi:hypothetical protein